MAYPPEARSAVARLAPSKIREVANVGMGRDDVLAFWFGESDEVTPDFIRAAANEALAAGDTFYTQNLGLPALREAIARYQSRLHRAVSAESVVVTNSGMSALMIATQALVGSGDRVVVVTPVWPNLLEIPKILGASVQSVPLRPSPEGWQLDLDALITALAPGTRMLILNSPANPTGWVMSAEAQRVVLEHCRRHGIWILSDDAYERLVFGETTAAPSFLDIADPDDRLVCANTFSKTWRMTGWRLGWLTAPRALVGALGTLVEYNTSCAPGFVQRAGLAAIAQGESDAVAARDRLRVSRDRLVAGLQAIEGVECPEPSGAMYAFFRIHGLMDSLALCKRLVVDAGLGLAPGAAFGPEAEGYVRWCFATSAERIDEGLERFRRGLKAGYRSLAQNR